LTIPQNSYAIIGEGYNPRWYQQNFENAMYSGYRRAYLLYHRRAGKDFSCWMFTIRCAANPENLPGMYYYILPTYTQGKKVIWDAIDESGKRFLDYIPKQWIEGKPNSQEMKIRLINGSLIQIVGSDNPDAIRGTNPKGVVFSEYALQDPRIWSEIVSPILVKNKGWAIFNTTPQGRNHAYELWDACQNSPYWYTQKLTIDDTKLFKIEDIEKEEPKKSEEVIQQEFFVSFSRGIDGSFYGKIIEKMRAESRIGNVAYEPRSVVNTAWDLGYGDSTVIVFWQQISTEVRIIDHYEAHGESLEHYAKVLKERPYNYGSHYFPHDAGSGNLQTGTTIQRLALDLGIKSIVLDREDIEPGIELARSMLSTCYIDQTKCKHLIKCLESYHKKFNDKMNCYSSTPVHDYASHSADAIRYMAVAKNKYSSSLGGISKDKKNELRMKHLGY
jgi:phage terminase large subunit